MQRSDSTKLSAETVLELVLLAIIEAHPLLEMENRQAERLQDAITTLLGRSPTHCEAVDRALVFMARVRSRDICNADMSMLAIGSDAVPLAARSVLDLAEIAARDVLGLTCVSEISVAANFLCREYRRSASICPVEYDPALEAMQDEAVQRILTELAEWGVPSVSRK